MRNIRKFVVAAGLTLGLALAGAAGTAGTAAATESAPGTATEMQIQSEGWIYVTYSSVVFSEYGGPSSIGSTGADWIYLYCQHDGPWGWWSYAWVPALNSYGWVRNGDVTGYTNPISWLNVC